MCLKHFSAIKVPRIAANEICLNVFEIALAVKYNFYYKQKTFLLQARNIGSIWVDMDYLINYVNICK